MESIKSMKTVLPLYSNFSDQSVTLAKRTLVARVLEGQATLLSTNCAPEEVFSILAGDENNVPKETRATEEGEELAPDTILESELPPEVRQMNLRNVHEVYHNDIRRMLAKHDKMWSGELRSVNSTVHRIEPVEGARPVRQMPYRQVPAGKEFEANEVDKMIM